MTLKVEIKTTREMKIGKILRATLIIIVGISLGILFTLASSNKTLATVVSNRCVEQVHTIGLSMYPTWNYETKVIVNKCIPIEDLKIGDIIAFTNRYEWVDADVAIHRIIKIDYEKRMISTRGDAPHSTKDYFPFEDYFGKVIGYIDEREVRIGENDGMS